MTETLCSTNPVAVDWPVRRRLAMVLIGYIPFLLVGLVIGTVFATARHAGTPAGLGCGLIVLYLFPPIACRVTSILAKPETGRQPVASVAFLHWWLSAQWQVVFNRLPMFEEALRIVPSLYSAWLRLWGAQVGSLVYWSPGVAVLDRPFVRVGNRVVFGAGVRLNPHVLVPGKKRGAQLWLAPLTLGDDALIGGYSLITAGCTIPAGTSLPAGKYLRPFSTWLDNEPAQSRYEGDSD